MQRIRRAPVLVYALAASAWFSAIAYLLTSGSRSSVDLKIFACNLVLMLSCVVFGAFLSIKLGVHRSLWGALALCVASIALLVVFTFFLDINLSCALDFPSGCL
jgi:hypothetical protein